MEQDVIKKKFVISQSRKNKLKLSPAMKLHDKSVHESKMC